MKLPLALTLTLAAFLFAPAARAETVDLGAYGRLSFTLDTKVWNINVTRRPGNFIGLTITPKNTNSNAKVGLDIVLDPGSEVDTKAKLRAAFLEDLADVTPMSVEKRANLKDIAGKSGYGYYVDFTDPDLVGKPPQKEDCKVMTMVMLILTPKVGVTGAVYTDGPKESAYTDMLAMFKSMEVLPATTKK